MREREVERRPPRARDDRSGGGGGGGFRDRDDRPRRQAPDRDFGELGHDYERSPEDTADLPMPESKINELLAERLQAKLIRDFQVADQIQEDLRASGNGHSLCSYYHRY